MPYVNIKVTGGTEAPTAAQMSFLKPVGVKSVQWVK